MRIRLFVPLRDFKWMRAGFKRTYIHTHTATAHAAPPSVVVLAIVGRWRLEQGQSVKSISIRHIHACIHIRIYQSTTTHPPLHPHPHSPAGAVAFLLPDARCRALLTTTTITTAPQLPPPPPTTTQQPEPEPEPEPAIITTSAPAPATPLADGSGPAASPSSLQGLAHNFLTSAAAAVASRFGSIADGGSGGADGGDVKEEEEDPEVGLEFARRMNKAVTINKGAPPPRR